MEHLIVDFVSQRTVYVDGEPLGFTNSVIEVEAGAHIIDLGYPSDYMPSQQDIVISGTTALDPKIVFFKIIGGSGPGRP